MDRQTHCTSPLSLGKEVHTRLGMQEVSNSTTCQGGLRGWDLPNDEDDVPVMMITSYRCMEFLQFTFQRTTKSLPYLSKENFLLHSGHKPKISPASESLRRISVSESICEQKSKIKGACFKSEIHFSHLWTGTIKTRWRLPEHAISFICKCWSKSPHRNRTVGSSAWGYVMSSSSEQ